MAVGSIEMTVDAATFRRIADAWSRLPVVYQLPVRAVGTLDPTWEVPANLRFSGLQFLLAVGRACARPEMIDDPARLFALFRYAHLITDRAQRLALKCELRDWDMHKKCVLSDECGCGIAFLAAERVLNVSQFLDLRTAIRSGWVRTSAVKTMQPDYIGVQAGSPPQLIVLEAKGTQSSEQYCTGTQIVKGCEQVRSVSSNYPIGARITVGAVLHREDQKHKSKVYIGDPEEDEHSLPYDLSPTPVKNVVRAHYLRIATLTGDSALMSHLDPERQPPTDDSHVVSRTVGDIEAVGSTMTFRHQQERLGMFFGLDARVRELLANGEWEPRFEQREQDGGSAAFAADGTVAAIWED